MFHSFLPEKYPKNCSFCDEIAKINEKCPICQHFSQKTLTNLTDFNFLSNLAMSSRPLASSPSCPNINPASGGSPRHAPRTSQPHKPRQMSGAPQPPPVTTDWEAERLILRYASTYALSPQPHPNELFNIVFHISRRRQIFIVADTLSDIRTARIGNHFSQPLQSQLPLKCRLIFLLQHL